MIRRLALAALISCATLPARAEDAVTRGAYLAAAAGCLGCHTASGPGAVPFAGGHKLKTPKGTFYGPNITPDPVHGIGQWTEADFLRALRQGKRRDGAHLYPVFPYTSYTRITDEDARALYAFFRSLPPSATPNIPHDIPFPYNIRMAMAVWKWMNFKPGAFSPAAGAMPELARGAYLVEALGHCGECHTERDWWGAVKPAMAFAGTKDGPDGKLVPNITPHPETGIGRWSTKDIVYFLETGQLPDGDVTGSLMDEVIRNGTSRLTDADRQAMAAYLQSLKPIAHKPKKDASKAP
jgi:mono/diheme cytochrome c family protein